MQEFEIAPGNPEVDLNALMTLDPESDSHMSARHIHLCPQPPPKVIENSMGQRVCCRHQNKPQGSLCACPRSDAHLHYVRVANSAADSSFEEGLAAPCGGHAACHCASGAHRKLLAGQTQELHLQAALHVITRARGYVLLLHLRRDRHARYTGIL